MIEDIAWDSVRRTPSKSKYSRKTARGITFKIGDIVQIVNPEFFVRVGFPMIKREILEDYYVSEEDPNLANTNLTLLSNTSFGTPNYNRTGIRTELDNRISKFLHDPTAPWFNRGGIDGRVSEKILDALVYAVLKARNFGGNERKIYTVPDPALANEVMEVRDKEIVRTGIYNNGRIKGRNNVILTVVDRQAGIGKRIEAKNCRLIKDSELVLMEGVV